jgi:16S rRNA (cytosine967-C5)-methyltransferase
MPPWLLARWQAQYGPDAAADMARAALVEPQAVINPDTGRQQDPGAQTIVPLLEIAPGMLVLDLCAAPGNKTAQIVALGARAVAADLYKKRLQTVDATAARVVLDAGAPLPFGPVFDRILVDAPCSGTGTLARNPEIKWRLREEDLAEFQTLQRCMLQNALACLKPGGRLVYATCSLEREENQDISPETHLRLPGRDPGDGFFASVVNSVSDTSAPDLPLT